MAVPDFVRRWSRSVFGHQLADSDIHGELSGIVDNGHWLRVSEELVSEDKYSNISEIVLLHERSKRYIRFQVRSLPYGIEDYGMEEDDDDDDIEEVFPHYVLKTEYDTSPSKPLSDARKLALAVLQGDKVAALALADEVLMSWVAKEKS